MTAYAGWIKAAIILALLAGLYAFAWNAGGNSVQAKWDRATLDAERSAANEQLRKQEIIGRNEEKRVIKAAKARETVQSNLAKVDHYAPTTAPPLPGSFRVRHDAAATGTEVDDTARANAPGVTLKAVATTVADNYAACLYDQQRLTTLQEIVRALNGDAK